MSADPPVPQGGQRTGCNAPLRPPGAPGSSRLLNSVCRRTTSALVLVIRPTQVLARRLKVHLHADAEGSTLLGDWYCHLVRIGRRQLVLAVSEEARLPVLLAVGGKAPFEARLTSAVEDMLRALGVPEELVAGEVERMSRVTFTKSRSRSVLGSIRDFANLAAAYLEVTDDLLDVALKLADAPCGPLRMHTPAETARELLGGRA